MKTKLYDWKVDEVLQTAEDRALYIQAAIGTNDSAYLAKALGNVSRIEGEKRIARMAKISADDFHADFSLGGNPSLRSFLRVIDALGFHMNMTPKASV